jgi:hypothetical protein
MRRRFCPLLSVLSVAHSVETAAGHLIADLRASSFAFLRPCCTRFLSSSLLTARGRGDDVEPNISWPPKKLHCLGAVSGVMRRDNIAWAAPDLPISCVAV